MSRNTEIEKYYFDRFRNIFPLPSGDLIYTDKPDVIIRGEYTLGIEITNLYLQSGENPTSEQRQRPKRERVLKQAQSAYLAAGGRNIEISVDVVLTNLFSTPNLSQKKSQL